jgi:hypothetical protein
LIFKSDIIEGRLDAVKDLRTCAKDIIDKYEAELASLGIKIELSKRYFETNVSERYLGGCCFSRSYIYSLANKQAGKINFQGGIL